MNDNEERDPRLVAIPDTHGHCKGEHKPYAEERPLPLTARMLFLWFYHACRRGYPRFLMVADHMNYLTFEDPAAVNLVRRALKLAQAGDLYGAAETANVDVAHAAVVGEGLRRGMRFSIGAEVDNDPRSRPDAQNIVDAMRPDAMIRSVHFVPIAHPVHGENWPWPFDNPEFSEHLQTVGAEQLWELYVTALVDAIERLPGQIVGHFYAPVAIGAWIDDAALEKYEDRVLAAVAERGMAIEFNTRFLYRDHSGDEKRRYLNANRRLLRKARDRGVAIAIGSDAHSPKDQGAAFEQVLAILDELEINELAFPIAGRLLRVALKVERKPEPEPPPPPPAPEPVRASAPAADAKPVRKARPAAKPARAPETAPARHPAAHDAPAEPAPKPAPAKPPAAKPAAAKPAAKSPAAKPATVTPAAAKVAQKVVAAAAKTVATAVVKTAAKLVAAKPKPTARKAAKPPAKPAPKAKPPAKKAAPAKKSAAKKAPARKSAPARPAVKKTAPAKKKAAPAKKTAAKKPVAKKAPARKAPAKKSAAKKAASKRR